MMQKPIPPFPHQAELAIKHAAVADARKVELGMTGRIFGPNVGQHAVAVRKRRHAEAKNR